MYVSPLAARCGGPLFPPCRLRPASSRPAKCGFFLLRVRPLEDGNLSLISLAKAEGAKVAPIGGGLLIYGLTYQEWTIRLMAFYALFLVIDGVGRRWVYPLVKFTWSRLRKRNQAPGDAGGQQ